MTIISYLTPCSSSGEVGSHDTSHVTNLPSAPTLLQWQLGMRLVLHYRMHFQVSLDQRLQSSHVVAC